MLLFICTTVVVYIYGAGSAPENCFAYWFFGGRLSSLSTDTTILVFGSKHFILVDSLILNKNSSYLLSSLIFTAKKYKKMFEK